MTPTISVTLDEENRFLIDLNKAAENLLSIEATVMHRLLRERNSEIPPHSLLDLNSLSIEDLEFLMTRYILEVRQLTSFVA